MQKIVIAISFLIAFASSVYAGMDGTYIFKATGYKGAMEAKMEGEVVHVKIDTVNLANGGDCGFESSGKLNGKTAKLSYKDEYMQSPIEISVMFSGKTANVKVLKPGNACGVGGLMGGKYLMK
jgi:hypothetical protein